jgi:hypothetical protein
VTLERRARRRAGGWLFMLALTVYLSTAGGSMTTTDAVVAFDLTRNIVEHGTVASSGDLLGLDALRGVDGRYYSPFGLAQSIYAIPFYTLGTAIQRWTGLSIGKPDTLPKAFVTLSQTLLVAIIVWLIFDLALHVTGRARVSLTAAVTCAFGSLLWPYAGFGFSQPLACATLLAGVRAAFLGMRLDRGGLLTIAGCWMGLSLLTRHEMGLGAAIVAVWIGSAAHGRLPDRLRRVARFVPGFFAGVAVWCAYNAVRFGHPFDTGHMRDPTPGFGSPIAEGLLGLLVSPAASLFLYSPFAVAGVAGLVVLARRDRASACLFGALFAGFLLLYANLGNWMGGRSYGGRYLLVTLPYVGIGWAVLLSELRGGALRAAATIAVVVGVLVQLPGVLLDYAKVSQQTQALGNYTTEERQWVWAAAPLVLNARALPGAISDNIAYVTGRAEPPAVTEPAGADDRSFSQQFAFSLDLWWLYLFYMGVLPRPALAAVAILLLTAVVICAIRLGQTARVLR